AFETPAAALVARHLDHELLELEADRVRLGLLVAPFDVVEHPFPFRALGRRARAPAARVLGGAVENRVAHGLGQLTPRRVEVELELPRQRRQHDLPQIPARLSPWQDHSLENRDARVAEDELFAHLSSRAEAAALRARAKRRVEREVPRLELGERDAARRTAVA